MKSFTKNIRRYLKIRASDQAMADGEFVIQIGESGVKFKRFGEVKGRVWSLSWRSIIGHALIHGGSRA